MKHSKKISLFLLLIILYVPSCFSSINYVHIPKCGGTTVKDLLDANFPKSEIYPYGKIGKYRIKASTEQAMKDVFSEFPEIRCSLVHGHFPMWFFKEKDPNYDTSFFFTILRDPIERVLSHDRFIMRNRMARGFHTKSDPLGIPGNLMCKMLCSDCRLEGEELLEDCIQNLERMDCILFIDDLENGLKSLFKRLGLHLPRSIPQLNTTGKRQATKQNQPPELLEEVRRKNALDIRLYEYCKLR